MDFVITEQGPGRNVADAGFRQVGDLRINDIGVQLLFGVCNLFYEAE